MNIKTSLAEVTSNIVNEVKGSSLFARHKFSPLSRLYTIIRALANTNFLFIDSVLVELLNAIHPHTASEDDLLEWVARYNLNWQPAIKAQHNVRIGSSTLPTAKINIPQSLYVSTPGDVNQKVIFKLLTGGLFIDNTTPVDGEGYYTVDGVVECLVYGESGNVVEFAISVLYGAPTGIDIVYNPDSTPLLSGGERESVASIREKIKNYENSSNALWTPTWFRAEAEAYEFVLRAIFVSSKDLGIPGTIKLLLIGTAYNPISQVNLDLVADTLNSEEKNPGGAVHVLTENVNVEEVDLTINVYFVDANSIPEQSILDNIVDEYFYGLGQNDPYIESDLRGLYFAIPYVVNVVVNPTGNVIPTTDYVLVPGTITVNGLVHGA